MDSEDPMIRKLIRTHAPDLEPMPLTIQGEPCLWGLYHCEKYDQDNKIPRYEPAYAPGGYFYLHSPDVQARWAVWGRDSACSYSNFQILYNTACELGYQGPPLALDTDALAILYVVKYIRTRIIQQGATKPEQVADAYNSGSFKDQYVPNAYIRKFMKYYDRAVRRQCPPVTTKNLDASTTGPTTSPVV
jgi:hypothetical protein